MLFVTFLFGGVPCDVSNVKYVRGSKRLGNIDIKYPGYSFSAHVTKIVAVTFT